MNACNCLECLDGDSDIKAESFKAKERKLLSFNESRFKLPGCPRVCANIEQKKITIAN